VVIISKGIGEMGQNLVWHSFSIDTSSVPNYKEIGRGHVKFMLIWYGMTIKCLSFLTITQKVEICRALKSYASGFIEFFDTFRAFLHDKNYG